MTLGTISHDDVLAEMMQDPQFAEAYEDARSLAGLREHLVSLRKDQRVKQSEVARRMGVSQSTISEFENSASDPRISTLQRYARAICMKLAIEVRPQSASAWAPDLPSGWFGHVGRDKPLQIRAVHRSAPSVTAGEAHGVSQWAHAAESKRSDFALGA